mgnify:CR=1 FL=1
MKEQIDRVTELTEQWYKLIGPVHHKDRCCHWYIETKWSYGLSPTYIVRHYGYILDEVDEEFETYEQALDWLKDFLSTAIEEEKESQNRDDLDSSW